MKRKVVVAYLAHAMTNRPWEEVREESDAVKSIMDDNGIGLLDPIDIEAPSLEDTTPTTSDKIPNRPDSGGAIAWYGDKRAIRKAHVVLDITPTLKSEGVLRELGYARFFLWKPVIRVYPPGADPHMITIFEDDAVAFSLEEAARIIIDRWGTPGKRLRWRLGILFKSLPKFIKYQFEEFKFEEYITWWYK